MANFKTPRIDSEKYRAGLQGSFLLLLAFFLAVVGLITATPLLHIGVFPFGYLFDLFLLHHIGFLPMAAFTADIDKMLE